MTAEVTSSRRSAPAKCRSCDRPMHSPLVCDSCQTLHSGDGFDHFELLGLDAGYDIDPETLRSRYFNLSRAAHPDRFPGAASEVLQLSLRLSAQINRAFEVLKQPVLRAEYLLELSGGPSSADDKSVPQDVLMRMLTLREEIEQARTTGDDETLRACAGAVAELYQGTLGEIAALARQLPGDDALRRALRTKLNTIKYYAKLREQLSSPDG